MWDTHIYIRVEGHCIGVILNLQRDGGPRCAGLEDLELGSREEVQPGSIFKRTLFFPRCVSDRQRSFALGIQWIVVRTLGMEQREFAHHSGLVVLGGAKLSPRVNHTLVGEGGSRTHTAEKEDACFLLLSSSNSFACDLQT